MHFDGHLYIHVVDPRGPPRGLREHGKMAFISGEQRPNFERTGEQRHYLGTGNIRKQIFDFGEQANLFQGNKGKVTPPGGPHLTRVLILYDFIY